MPQRTGAAAVRSLTKGQALIQMPLPLATVLADKGVRRWLARGKCAAAAPAVPPFERLLEHLGHADVRAGRAALRLWGHSGKRPQGWIAAADPVWLRAGMEIVILQAPAPGDVSGTELEALFADLQRSLFSDRPYALQVHDAHGYLSGTGGMPTAELPPALVDTADPEACRPGTAESPEAAALTSEIQMLLHDHPVNTAREQRGRIPLNDLWFWGGGTVPAVEPMAMPAAYCDDPLLHGYWQYRDSTSSPWPGSVDACLQVSPEGFVAGVPPTQEAADTVAGLRRLWQSRQLRRLTLLFNDASVVLERGPFVFLRRRDRAIMKWPST